MIGWLQEFPTLDQASLRILKKAFDSGYRSFSRTYGDAIEGFFDPLLYFLVWFERFLLATPWWLVIVVVAAVCYLAGRSWRLSVFVVVALFLIGYLGMWEDTMRTLAIIFVSTLIAIAIGIPVGVWMSRSDRVQSSITPLLDIMQTMPSSST